MKTFLPFLLSSFILCGCHDARVSKLETRITELEQIQSLNTGSIEHLTKGEKDFLYMIKGNSEDISNLAFAVELLNSQQATLATMQIMMLTNSPARIGGAGLPASRPVQYAYREGIPVSVYNQIATAAATQYPSNYEMQEAKIRWQVEAYKKLHQ